ncbi:MAG: type I-B CRISPR-associated protein Cas7/Cst2/DevR [Hyphomicrobiales bacterium]
MDKNLKTQGFILIDVDVVALNNAGKNSSSNFDNAVATKRVYKNGRSYVYVSGQAWRYWWRESLQKNCNWDLSPIARDKKIAFTSADPMRYADDDIFGYMKAEKKETVTRVSPLKNSAIVSACSVIPAENWSSMSRQEGDAVPFSKQEYSAIMKGMFSLDLSQVGVFANYNKTGFVNLSDSLKKEALENGAVEIDDPFVKDEKGEPKKLVQLDSKVRKQRAIDTIKALKYISGGAMQTNNMGDVTPKFIILASTTTGNHPFSHVVKSNGAKDDLVVLNIDGIKEILEDYKDTFEGDIFIGIRSGFMDEYKEKLLNLEKDFNNVKILSVNKAIDEYCVQLEKQVK